VLLKADGVTILTDPVFSTYAGLGIGPLTIGVKRLIDTPLALEALPQVDLIVLSHAHMDHLDVPSLRALESRGTQVVTARSTADLLRPERYAGVHEMGWGETVQAGPVTVKALEVNHWGARMRTDTYRGYNGYVLKTGKHRILFAGDTADTDSFRQVGGVDLAVFPIGAYNPWIRAHCNPEQAWRMANDARAGVVLPVHHKTFRLSNEPQAEPLERLHAAAGNASRRIGWGEIGDTFRWS
jgi:L-ascorbate metabolism protein UlaG (beta-lactamase superfamily)